MRHIPGLKSFAWGAFETSKLIDWIVPVLLTGSVTYLGQSIVALSEFGGWRAVLAGVLVMVGRGIYMYVNNNSSKRT